jgi:hypothetical protein
MRAAQNEVGPVTQRLPRFMKATFEAVVLAMVLSSSARDV